MGASSSCREGRLLEKAMSPNPNTDPATGVIIPSRRAPFLEARNIAPPRAPRPEALKCSQAVPHSKLVDIQKIKSRVNVP